jgi:predicted dehydrogenase
MPTPAISRRRFLAQSTLAVGLPALIPGHVLARAGQPGANDRIAIAAIGIGNRAKLLLDQLPEGGQIVGLCDCNLPRAAAFAEKKKVKWPICNDYRSVLERKDVDAVIIATADFQRVLPCMHACQAGKDVYAEKPLTLYVREGRALVRAVRHYKRVLQVGSQQRSMTINRIACEFVRNGGLGKYSVETVNYPGSKPSPARPFAEQSVPQGLDWNVWLNQTAMRPFNDAWFQWKDWREFGGGELSNWGAHGVDQVQWAVGMSDSGPAELWPLEKPGQVAMQYANGVVVRFIRPKAPMGGAVFIGDKGKLEINRNKVTSNPKEIAANLMSKVDAAAEEKKWSDQTALWQARWHMQNWLDCIRSRAVPVADVEIGHRSISACHLVGITRELGRKLTWDPVKEEFVGDEEANRLLDRPRRKGFELPEIA